MTKPKYVIDATLHLFGDALEPAQISELLGVKASSSWRKGDKLIERSTGKEWPRKYGRWSVSVDTEPDRLDLPSVIDRLIARAGPKWETVKTLPGVTKTRVSFYISFDPEAHGKIAIEFELSEQNIAALKTIGGEVFFTVDRSSPEEP